MHRFNRSTIGRSARNFVNRTNQVMRSTAGKVGAGATAFLGSAGAAVAATPGAAIAGSLSDGTSQVMLVIGAVALILGALILWAYVKRAR